MKIDGHDVWETRGASSCKMYRKVGSYVRLCSFVLRSALVSANAHALRPGTLRGRKSYAGHTTPVSQLES
jgi:hypothetical protein